MICVSIGRSRHKHVMAEHKHLVDEGAELVELRLDYIAGEIKLKQLIADRPCAVIVTCRREADGGKYTGPENERVTLLRTAIAEGVEYVDLEEDIASDIPRFGKTKRIVSLHDFRRTPADLPEIHRRLAASDPDVIKVCTMANHPDDNFRMFELMRDSEIPTIGICMGDIGIPSRVLAGRFGAPFSYATFHHERALAPGQLSYDQMKNVYRYDKIDSETDIYGVIADPVGHSLSPLIHNAAFEHLGMNKVYLPFRVPREDLAQFIEDCPKWGIKGLSVTIPHKEEVVRSLTQADGAIRGIGACNTVLLNGDERLGFNTDYRAAMSSLEEAMCVNPEDSKPFAGKTALVLGAGGVGKAVAYGLLRRGAKLVLADGVSRHAGELAKRFECRWVEWARRHNVTATDLLVNCTPVGMHPEVDETPFEKHYLRPSMVVFDAVYNPENTMLVKEARSRNCNVVTGVDMFVRQACLQFKHFTGEEGPADLMRDVLKRATGAARY